MLDWMTETSQRTTRNLLYCSVNRLFGRAQGIDAVVRQNSAREMKTMSTALITPQPTPKTQLLGLTLASGWTLVERIDPTQDSTGGSFGVGYKATKENQIAFVKAIDFVDALKAQDPAAALFKLTAIASFEKDVLAYCAARGMSKILRETQIYSSKLPTNLRC